MVAVVCLIGLFMAYRAWDRHQMRRAVLEWGRLAPFPESARDFRIQTEGSMFSRAFRVSFTAPIADIDRWLGESPGTRDVAPERPGANVRRFLISPGKGAQKAEITVEDSTGEVRVYVAWS